MFIAVPYLQKSHETWKQDNSKTCSPRYDLCANTRMLMFLCVKVAFYNCMWRNKRWIQQVHWVTEHNSPIVLCKLTDTVISCGKMLLPLLLCFFNIHILLHLLFHKKQAWIRPFFLTMGPSRNIMSGNLSESCQMTAVSMSIYGDGLNNQTALGLLYLQTHTIYHMSLSSIQSQQRVNIKQSLLSVMQLDVSKIEKQFLL